LAREILRDRFSQRGIAVTSAALVAALSPGAAKGGWTASKFAWGGSVATLLIAGGFWAGSRATLRAEHAAADNVAQVVERAPAPLVDSPQADVAFAVDLFDEEAALADAPPDHRIEPAAVGRNKEVAAPPPVARIPQAAPEKAAAVPSEKPTAPKEDAVEKTPPRVARRSPAKDSKPDRKIAGISWKRSLTDALEYAPGGEDRPAKPIFYFRVLGDLSGFM
jgi:hypothetical protein